MPPLTLISLCRPLSQVQGISTYPIAKNQRLMRKGTVYVPSMRTESQDSIRRHKAPVTVILTKVRMCVRMLWYGGIQSRAFCTSIEPTYIHTYAVACVHTYIATYVCKYTTCEYMLLGEILSSVEDLYIELEYWNVHTYSTLSLCLSEHLTYLTQHYPTTSFMQHWIIQKPHLSDLLL